MRRYVLHDHTLSTNGTLLSVQQKGSTPLDKLVKDDPALFREVSEKGLVLREEVLKLAREKAKDDSAAPTTKKQKRKSLPLSDTMLTAPRPRRSANVVRYGDGGGDCVYDWCE